MNKSWKNTREAIKSFADELVCNECEKEPIDAMRYTNCGHFFCQQCVGNDSICIKCDTPVQPTEIQSDPIIRSLASYCNQLAEIIQEKDLWNAISNASSTLQASSVVVKAGSKDTNLKSKQPFIPKRNINKSNAKGETPLHVACLKNDEKRVKFLLAAGANPNTKDNAHWTPLQEVVSYGFTNICQLLLECGALSNVPGAENRTALHEAAISNRLVEAKMLLQYSARKDVYDKHGKKPIDYCKPFGHLWNVLEEKNELDDTFGRITNLNSTLDQTFSATQSVGAFVIFASNLREENNKRLHEMAVKHKVKVTSVFRSIVSHVIVEANNQNIVQLSYDVMMAVLRGIWLLNSEWIQLAMDVDDILKVDLELFEISGIPVQGIPRKARESAQNQNPGLFNQCYFYFALHASDSYCVSGMQLTRDELMRLVEAGNGKILKREPYPEDIKYREQIIPFHIANEPSHPLYKCIHYIIYVPGKDEPRIKYNMPHIKTLPLLWLIECIEKFTLVDPSHIGLL